MSDGMFDKHDGGSDEGKCRSGSDRGAFDSRDLFRGRQEIEIIHEGEVYRLRLTRNGRLILNK